MGLFSKKDKLSAGDDDAAKKSLFGGRKSPSPSSPNPYAAPPPPYSSGNPQSTNPGARAPALVDQSRDALFNGRRPGAANQLPPPSNAYGQPAGGSQGAGYGQERKLTAEEEEDEDVEGVKQQIRFTKNKSVESSRNALQVAAQAEETARGTLTKLALQGEMLYNTEKNLDVAAAHGRVADEKARELKTVNGSMFAIHMKNPMRSKSRAEAEEKKILERHQSERDDRDQARKFAMEGKDIVGNALKKNGGRMGGSAHGRAQMSLAEKSKYQFEADESDDEKEKQIHNNLDQLSAITGRLHGLAVSTGQEVDRQNKMLPGITAKSDRVDDQIIITHNKIKKYC